MDSGVTVEPGERVETGRVILGTSDTLSYLEEAARAEGGLTHRAHFRLPDALPPGRLRLPGLRVVLAETGEDHRVLLLERPGEALVEISSRAGRVDVVVLGRDHRTVADLWCRLRRRGGALVTAPDRIRVTLWSNEAYSPGRRSHEVAAVRWSEVRRNYPVATARALDGLMDLARPEAARGRLVLWHGPPGTGKTSAVASLATQWQPWCETHVVTDPERFFSDPDYLMSVEESPERLEWDAPLPEMDEPWPRSWKLIVCEDADEYLRSDARQRSGPALGRLLNLTDGLMGRGRDTVVLLTTNDDVGRLHPAVTRPGRCLAQLAFPPLSAPEAAAWCPEGVTPPSGPATLAELYARLGGDGALSEEHATGLYL